MVVRLGIRKATLSGIVKGLEPMITKRQGIIVPYVMAELVLRLPLHTEG